MSVMKIRDENGVFQPVRSLVGPEGPKGEPGKDGYTPKRGTDYWTDADRQQIVSDVLASLPNASGVNF